MIYAVRLQCTDYDASALSVEPLDLSKGPAFFWINGELETVEEDE